jgi:hypothetical protein
MRHCSGDRSGAFSRKESADESTLLGNSGIFFNGIFEGTTVADLNDFRMRTRVWLQEHCPEGMRSPMSDYERVEGGDKRRSSNPDSYIWLERMMQKRLVPS